MKHLFINGTGGVGLALIENLLRLNKTGRADRMVVSGVSDRSGHFLLSPQNGDRDIEKLLATVIECKRAGGSLLELAISSDQLTACPKDKICTTIKESSAFGGGSIFFIDATATDTTEEISSFLAQGGYVVAANKIPFALPMSAPLSEIYSYGPGRLGLESTVGAAIPTIKGLRQFRQLVDGDFLLEASVSGTLAFVTTMIEQGRSFRQSLDKAMELGYTEPNPGDDLSAADVVRKAVILTRQMGVFIDADEIKFEAFLPGEKIEMNKSCLLENSVRLGAEFSKKFNEAKKLGLKLKYLISINDNETRVGWQKIDESSPFWSVSDGSNMMSLSSPLAGDFPLILRGAGAGNQATAYGILSDVISMGGGKCLGKVVRND